MIDRLRVSYPALKAAKVDPGLKRLFLAELITQACDEGIEVILPEGTSTRVVSREDYKRYRDAMAGLEAAERQREVQGRLVQMGLGGYQRPPQDPPTYGEGETSARTRTWDS